MVDPISRVFISYAHDSAQHMAAVLRLHDLLRAAGVGMDFGLTNPCVPRRLTVARLVPRAVVCVRGTGGRIGALTVVEVRQSSPLPRVEFDYVVWGVAPAASSELPAVTPAIVRSGPSYFDSNLDLDLDEDTVTDLGLTPLFDWLIGLHATRIAVLPDKPSVRHADCAGLASTAWQLGVRRTALTAGTSVCVLTSGRRLAALTVTGVRTEGVERPRVQYDHVVWGT